MKLYQNNQGMVFDMLVLPLGSKPNSLSTLANWSLKFAEGWIELTGCVGATYVGNGTASTHASCTEPDTR